MKLPIVYIMASKRNGTLYTGVTSQLIKRVYEHKNDVQKGFSQVYSCKMLVFYEICADMKGAIEREKQIKGGSRDAKLALIEELNPLWRDLYEDLV